MLPEQFSWLFDFSYTVCLLIFSSLICRTEHSQKDRCWQRAGGIVYAVWVVVRLFPTVRRDRGEGRLLFPLTEGWGLISLLLMQNSRFNDIGREGVAASTKR